MADADCETVECPVRVALVPAMAMRVVAAMYEGRSTSHLRTLFDGTSSAAAVLTLCAVIDKARFENPDKSVRIMLRLAAHTDDGDLDLRLTL